MVNALKYIKELEAVGFRRDQAETQVQILIDAAEGALVTKQDLASFKHEIAHQFTQFEYRIVTKIVVAVVVTITLATGLLAWIVSAR